MEILKGRVSPKSVAVKVLSFGIPIGVSLTKQSNDTDTTAFMLAALNPLSNETKPMVAPLPEDRRQVTAQKSSIETIPSAVKDTAVLIAAGKERLNPVIETITTSYRIMQFRMYDNGVEDGDSISILYNNRVIKNNIEVTARPVAFELVLDEAAADHIVTIIAHNLGSIPPNTAMLEIKAGTKMYNINASADLRSNAIIRVKYEATS